MKKSDNNRIPNNTFTKYKYVISDFLDDIFETSPDYIVPVEKKGCKLLRSVDLPINLIEEKVRYLQFFLNSDVELGGKKIVVIDDASKYTSTLYKYRDFFERQGAVVYTYSFVGQKKLEMAEREKYDVKAKIYKYLEESTYQEYILQQAYYLSSDENFFDIDHFVIKVNISPERFKVFLSSLNSIGEIEFTNDVYTPQNIEKFCLFNFNLPSAEVLFDIGVDKGALQKIRFAYNSQSRTLTIALMSFPVWDSNVTDITTLFKNVPFELPYEQNDFIMDEGVFYNIAFVFHVYLLRSFLNNFSNFKEFSNFRIEKNDLIAYIGLSRAKNVVKSVYQFLEKEIDIQYVKKSNFIDIPHKKTKKFKSINEIMDELRKEYEILVNKAGSLLDVKYFLSYEEIISRYEGRASLMKWIDILCDRGVLVTRNHEYHGIFYRACRSGEGDYNHIEEKSYHLLPLIISTCGELDKKEHKFYRINSTYLNKVIANLVYDYPKEDYDFHAFFTKPHNYGPLTYLKDQLDNETDIPIYSAEKISKYCTYDEQAREFISYNLENIGILNSQYFGQNDAVPFTELAAYLGFFKHIKEKGGSDNFLNAMAICRDQEIYYHHVLYNIKTAYSNIIAVQHIYIERQMNIEGRIEIIKRIERLLRDAAANVNSAKTKLDYDQNNIYEHINGLTPDMVFEQARKRILDSFQFFDLKFKNNVLPKLKTIASIEYLMTNIMLFYLSNEKKFLERFSKGYACQHDIVLSEIDTLQNILKNTEKWNSDIFVQYKNLYLNIIEELSNFLRQNFDQLPKSQGKNNKKKQRNLMLATNQSTRYIVNNHLNNITILYYDFSGFKNFENEKNISVVTTVQEEVAKLISSEMNGKVIFGSTGSEEYGMIIFDAFQSALDFSQQLTSLFASNKFLNQIIFRFGCSYRNVKQFNDEIVKDALFDAVECSKETSNKFKNILIISKKSKTEMQEMNNDMYFKPSNNDELFYEYTKLENSDENVIKYDKNTDDNCKIGIITVLLKEYVAMKEMMTDQKRVIFPKGGLGDQFVIGKIKAFGGGEHRVVLARTMGDGNNKAAIRASKLIEHFPKLDVIIMVGIAGGTPVIMDKFPDNDMDIIEKHVRLGDIVVSDSIIQFDYQKNMINKIELKGGNIPPSPKLMQAKQTLEESDEHPWEKYISMALNDFPNKYQRPDISTDILYDSDGNQIPHPIDSNRNIFPYIFSGKIASSNTLLKNPRKRNELKKKYGVLAIEMESSGIADATWENSVGYYVVRGISDYCDSHKNNIWHSYASLVAAAYTRSLIEKIPLTD